MLGPQDLVVELEVSQDAVQPGEQITATVRIHNPSSSEISARAAQCLFYPRVSQGSEDKAWVGTSLGCVDGQWTYRIAAGATESFAYELTASEIRLLGLEPPVAAPPGEYALSVAPTIGVRAPEPVLIRVVEFH